MNQDGDYTCSCASGYQGKNCTVGKFKAIDFSIMHNLETFIHNKTFYSYFEISGQMVKLKKVVGSIFFFLAQFIKTSSHYNKIGHNINVLQQTACLVVYPITVGNLVSSLIERQWVRLLTL